MDEHQLIALRARINERRRVGDISVPTQVPAVVAAELRNITDVLLVMLETQEPKTPPRG